MRFDWALTQRRFGVIVLQPEGRVTVLEFNAFLGRIGSGEIAQNDVVVAQVLTNGVRRRAGDLNLFAMVRSGAVRTEDLPRHAPSGIIATGEAARRLLRAMEKRPDPDAETLLRALPTAPPVGLPQEMLRPAVGTPAAEPPEELPRPAAPFAEL